MLYNKKVKARWGLIKNSLLIFILIIITLIAVSNMDQMREFFSRASGEKANLVVNANTMQGVINRPWRNLAQGGEAHDWRLEPIISQVKALNPKYIRIDHIYDFYEIVDGSPGNLSFNFTHLDPILNDILATGAKPYIVLSYMPPAIATGDIVSEPVRYEDWQLVVQRTIEHISGTRVISDVYYEVWNEPDLFGNWSYYGSKNYLTLYTHASRGAQNARGVQPFKIGGPGITALYKNWFDAMAKHATKNNLRYDFFSWHRYSHSIEQFRDDLSLVNSWQQKYPSLHKLELHITEWGHDSENHVGYDTTYSAAHAVATSIEMVDFVEKAFIFEIQDGKDPEGKSLWGRWGIIGHQDFGSQAKPRYHALKMLDRLSDQRIQLLGKGSWIKAIATKNIDGTIEVLLANFDSQGQNFENVPITFQQINPGTFLITKEYLNGQQSSQQVSTSSAILKTNMVMNPNTVGILKLRRMDQ